MPDISDMDARVLALCMYYTELADRVSPSDAQQKVGKVWAESWENTGEETIIDQCSQKCTRIVLSFFFANAQGTFS